MRADIYLHASKESNHDKGQELGLTGEALKMFMHACCEVKLTVDVDTATGETSIVAVDDKPIVSST